MRSAALSFLFFLPLTGLFGQQQPAKPAEYFAIESYFIQ
jgi:hypothetical protein